jgi:alkylation response protein AidB-like acyl-CoA dehydrogenase
MSAPTLLDADERLALLDAVRDFAATRLAPNANSWDAEYTFPRDVLRSAGDLGLGGIYASERHGGAALSRRDAVAVFEQLAYGDTAIAAYISIHNMVVWMIDTFGSDELRAEWVPPLVAMESLGSYCLSEPEAGSDAGGLVTRAERSGDDYVINGVKQFISGAGEAAAYVVMARTGAAGNGGISAVLVPADARGLSFGPNEKKMGWHAQPTRQVVFGDVRVPAGNLLSAEGDGFTIAMRALNGGRLNIGACSVGGAQWALSRALTYVAEREAFGKPLSANQSIVFTLADMETQLQAARALLERAATKLDDGADDLVAACAMAKRFSTDVAFDVANAALQLHGGYGYLHDFGIERVVRDLRVHQIVEGTNEVMRLVVGRHLLGGRR